MANKVRHICGISGGKDSSALAVYMRNQVPEMEYFFCDTGAELPETYEYLDRLEVSLGKKIERLNSNKGFDHYFGIPYSNDMVPRWLMEDEKVVAQTAELETLQQKYTEKAVQFIEEAKDGPFFLYMPHTYPHIPLGAG